MIHFFFILSKHVNFNSMLNTQNQLSMEMNVEKLQNKKLARESLLLSIPVDGVSEEISIASNYHQIV